jgi:AcrR family transcriptional regulator
MHTVTTAPGARRRRTRPRNRRDQIIEAATALFASQGFQSVTLAEVAAAVEVTPSALYRHFSSKYELFAVCVRASAAIFQAAAGTGPAALTDIAASQRDRAVLYLREAAYLPGDAGGPPSLALTGWVSAVRAQRPGLTEAEASYLVAAALGALAGTVAYAHTPMTAPVKALLTRLMTAVTGTGLPVLPTAAAGARASHGDRAGPPGGPQGPASGQQGPARSRRETALGAAASLFRRHGYGGVGIDEIGAAAGITGSGMYRHFDSKEDLLVTAFRRTGDRLASEAVRAASMAGDPQQAMLDVVTAYVQAARRDVDLLFIYMHEARNLPTPARREMSALQNDLYQAWEHAARRAYPGLPAVTRTAIVAAIGVINAAVIAEPPDQSWITAVGHQALRAVVTGT